MIVNKSHSKNGLTHKTGEISFRGQILIIVVCSLHTVQKGRYTGVIKLCKGEMVLGDSNLINVLDFKILAAPIQDTLHSPRNTVSDVMHFIGKP